MRYLFLKIKFNIIKSKKGPRKYFFLSPFFHKKIFNNSYNNKNINKNKNNLKNKNNFVTMKKINTEEDLINECRWNVKKNRYAQEHNL